MTDAVDVLTTLRKELAISETMHQDKIGKRLAEIDYHYHCGQLHAYKRAQDLIREIIEKQRNQDAINEGD